jgi:hypothetical protein
MRRVAAISALALLSVTTASALAQSPESMEAAVVAHGPPHSFQVASIALSSSASPVRAVAFQMQVVNGFDVVGPKRGTIAAGRQSLLVTLAIPRDARAGRTRAALVTLTRADGTSSVISLDADVARVRSVEIRAAGERVGVLRGERLEVSYRLANRGNAPESLDVHLVAPAGWTSDGAGTVLAADPGAELSRAARVTVPNKSATGAVFVWLYAMAGRDTLGRTSVAVEVADPATRDRTNGALVTLGTASTYSPGGAPGVAHSVAIDGQLTSDVRIAGQMTVVSARGQSAIASPLGYGPRTPSLMLAGDSWHLQLGTAVATLPELAGASVFGRGLAFDATRGPWNVTAVAAQPDGYGAEASGEFVASRLARQLGDAWVGVTMSHLVERRLATEQLDAIAADVAVPLMLGASVNAELGHRRYERGEGMGWRAEFRRIGGGPAILVRVARAPGGSSAFGRSAQDLSAFVSQSLGRRGSIAGSVWRTGDSSLAWTRVTSDGWTVRPTLRLNHVASLSVDGRHSAFTATGAAGVMGTMESSVGGTLDTHLENLDGSAGVTASTVSRSATTPGGASMRNSAPREQVRALLSHAGAYGRVEMNATAERTGEGLGLPTRQASYGARVDDVPLLQSLATRAHLSVQQYDWFGDRPSMFSANIGADFTLPGGRRLSLEAQRNPYLVALGGSGAWLVTVRIEQGLHVPRFGRSDNDGLVFRDLDGNSRQDAGEPGVAGVIVRRGGETAVTDADGRFRFATSGVGVIQVDVRSLPPGVVAPPTGAADSVRHEIGLVAVSSAEVHLVLVDGAASRVSAKDLAKVIVSARDSAGRSWLARSSGDAVVAFDALPPGRYTVEVDAAGSDEPLWPAAELPVLRVRDGATPLSVEVLLRARAMKVRVMSPGPADGQRP